MQQLSGIDASFLYFETPNAPGHVFSVYICDQSTAPGGKVTFKGILDHVRSRLHVSRAFRQRLVEVPFGLDHPYWIEDADFDLEYHVRHIALPRARRLAPAVHPDRPAALASAGPQPTAVGDVRHRGAGQRRRLARRQLRGHDQGPPCRGRRRDAAGDHQRAARPDARRAAAGAAVALAPRAPAQPGRAAVPGDDERRGAADADQPDDGRLGTRAAPPGCASSSPSATSSCRG